MPHDLIEFAKAPECALYFRAANNSGGNRGERMAQVDWIAVDWGTTRLRVWSMAKDGSVLAEKPSDQGMDGLAPSEFEPALLALIGDWLSDDDVTDVVACGMVGARQGWIEAAYSTTPCAPLNASACISPTTADPRIRVHIIPGLCQQNPADVMRGEETQIAGFLANQPDYEGLICLPGTHSKWAQVADGQVHSFNTFMTGEIFALLAEHSVLRHSVVGTDKSEWDAEAFRRAVADAFETPAMLTTHLFAVRAKSLLAGDGAGTSRAALSGALIGTELAAAGITKAQITLIGDAGLCERYLEAMSTLNCPAKVADSSAATLAGLTAAQATLE